MLTWNIRGGAWEREWTEHPDGYGLSIDENAKAQLAERVDDAREQLADARAQLSEKMDDAKEQLAAVHEMRSDERRAQTEAAREQLQAKLDELQPHSAAPARACCAATRPPAPSVIPRCSNG